MKVTPLDNTSTTMIVAAPADGLPDEPPVYPDGLGRPMVDHSEYAALRAKAQELQTALAVALETHKSIMRNHDEVFEQYVASNNSLHRQLEAALEREKALTALLKRYRNETPLGHQPHMIAHEVDAALGGKP